MNLISTFAILGYGHIAPKTKNGKVVTIFYAILGIPLMLLCLSNIGDVMASSFRYDFPRPLIGRPAGIAVNLVDEKSRDCVRLHFPLSPSLAAEKQNKSARWTKRDKVIRLNCRALFSGSCIGKCAATYAQNRRKRDEPVTPSPDPTPFVNQGNLTCNYAQSLREHSRSRDETSVSSCQILLTRFLWLINLREEMIDLWLCVNACLNIEKYN